MAVAQPSSELGLWPRVAEAVGTGVALTGNAVQAIPDTFVAALKGMS
ncbi:hypothetical protein [Saccharothrix deserti]|nr:hypothetical protein [Saccharothrix deserti]